MDGDKRRDSRRNFVKVCEWYDDYNWY